MVTFNFQKLLHDGDRFLLYSKGVCMSGDEKPTEGIANGSELLEMDTSTKYKFNLANSQWVKVVGDCCGLAEEINRLSAIVPDPTAADTGKVLTASGEGSGSWEQASGGGNKIIITLDDSDAVTVTCNGTQMTDPNDIYALVGDAPVQAFYRVLSEGYWETRPVLEFQNLGTFILYRTPSTVYVDEERLPGLAYMQDYTVVFSDSRWVFIRQRSTYLCFKGGIF